MNLQKALTRLDPTKDEHWTSDGLPRVDVVSALVGGAVTRRDITDGALRFTRTRAESGDGGFAPVGTPGAAPGAVPEEAPAAPAPAPSEDAPEAPEAPTEAPAAPEAPAVEPATKEAPAEAPPGDGDPAEGESPVEDARRAAHVESLDPVVAMAPGEVFKDVALVDRAIDEFGRQATILTARREAVVEQLKDIGRRSALLTTARNRLTRGGAQSRQASTIQDYLKAQQRARMVRAERAKRFIEAGTTAEDVKEQLVGPSKIDAAMRQRKPGRDTARPAYPVAAGA